MYERRSRLSKAKRDRLVEHFVAGTTARAAAELVGVHRNTAASFYTRIRTVIAEETQKASSVCGEIEVDESYFGGRRKGKRGRGAGWKVPVFGLLKRGGRVYTVMIPNARTDTLMPIMERLIQPRQHRLHGWLFELRCSGCVGLPPCSDQPLGTVRRRTEPHQWDRELLEPGKAASSALQRGAQTEFSPLPEGVRMALQWR